MSGNKIYRAVISGLVFGHMTNGDWPLVCTVYYLEVCEGSISYRHLADTCTYNDSWSKYKIKTFFWNASYLSTCHSLCALIEVYPDDA